MATLFVRISRSSFWHPFLPLPSFVSVGFTIMNVIRQIMNVIRQIFMKFVILHL